MMNDVHRTYFPAHPLVRSCTEVRSLAHEGLEIEIGSVAAILGRRTDVRVFTLGPSDLVLSVLAAGGGDGALHTYTDLDGHL
jgi:hypothetical protein